MSTRTSTAAWQRLRRVVLDRDGWRCRKCGRAGKLEIDHIRPVRAGGTDDLDNLDNLRAMCRSCHIERHRKPQPRGAAAWDRYLAAIAAAD